MCAVLAFVPHERIAAGGDFTNRPRSTMQPDDGGIYEKSGTSTVGDVHGFLEAMPCEEPAELREAQDSCRNSNTSWCPCREHEWNWQLGGAIQRRLRQLS